MLEAMSLRWLRVVTAVVLVLAAAGTGYLHGSRAARKGAPRIAVTTVTAPAPGSVRVLYSLARKQNDREIIALIDAAKTRAYFAIYEFTLKDVADALVRAKRRGLDVRGLVDRRESAKSYDAPIMAELLAAGIPIETENHADGGGIMHIKALVTDAAYAIGSYNWTASATTRNDELLEIGTDPALVATYAKILEALLTAYAGTKAPAAGAAAKVLAGTYDFTAAAAHVGEYAAVQGTLVDAHRSARGTVFLDFCASYKSCPFSAVIFGDDVSKFGDLSRFDGKRVTLTGTISSYRHRAEIKITDPSQLASGS